MEYVVKGRVISGSCIYFKVDYRHICSSSHLMHTLVTLFEGPQDII